MKSVMSGVATLLALGVLLLPSCVHADSIRVLKGTDVPMIFDQEVSSKTAKKGDLIALHIDKDVVIGDKMIFKGGTKVTALITGVQHRANFGINAKLKLQFSPVPTVYGPLIDLEAKSKGKTTGSRSDHAAEISGGAAVLLGPVGLVGGYFVVGKQVNIKKGDKIMAEVARDTDIVKSDDNSAPPKP